MPKFIYPFIDKDRMDERTLNDMRVGDTAKVLYLDGRGPLRRRMMEMGITKGCVISVRNFAPLGDPMEIEVRGYCLTIRKGDAGIVHVSENIGDGA